MSAFGWEVSASQAFPSDWRLWASDINNQGIIKSTKWERLQIGKALNISTYGTEL